jgi:predicted nucleic acid-binding protein
VLLDLFLDGAVDVIGLTPHEMEAVIGAAERFHLDFDDAYQYALAEHYMLTIVSFDTDFDRTEKGRRTPGQVAFS